MDALVAGGYDIPVFAALKKNPVWGKEPKAVSIIGKDGIVVVLDPRRVRPLPDQPRWANSPALSKKSISELSESIRILGQTEAGKVCLTNEPGYDAQLIDGERRLRACLVGKFMFKALVDERLIAPKDLFVLSVLSNFGSEDFTRMEKAHIVRKLHTEMGMTFDQISVVFKKTGPTWAQQHESLLKLDPEVQALIEPDTTVTIDGEEITVLEPSTARRNKRSNRRTQGLAYSVSLTLVDLPAADQKAVAKHIIRHDMTVSQARRHVINYRREGGHEKGTRRNRPKERFETLSSLVRRTIDEFGIFEDMPNAEFEAFVRSRSDSERVLLGRELDGLIITLQQFKKAIIPAGKTG